MNAQQQLHSRSIDFLVQPFDISETYSPEGKAASIPVILITLNGCLYRITSPYRFQDSVQK